MFSSKRLISGKAGSVLLPILIVSLFLLLIGGGNNLIFPSTSIDSINPHSQKGIFETFAVSSNKVSVSKNEVPIDEELTTVVPIIKDNNLNRMAEMIAPARIQGAFAITSSQANVTVTEWPIPTTSSGPLFTAFGPPNFVYFTENNANKIGRLDTTHNVITEWVVPTPNSKPYGIIVDPAGNVWFSENISSGSGTGNSATAFVIKIGRLNPATNGITEYNILSGVSFSAPNLLSFDSQGNLWWTSNNGATGNIFVSKLDVATNTVTRWNVYPYVDTPYGIGVDSYDSVFFTGLNNNRIAKLEPDTNILTYWNVPQPASGPQTLSIDSNNKVWFGESAGNRIAKLDPDRNQITQWIVPTGNSIPAHIKHDSSELVVFTEYNGNKVGTLDPATNLITEWAMPQGANQPIGISMDLAGNVYIVELGSNRLARIN